MKSRRHLIRADSSILICLGAFFRSVGIGYLSVVFSFSLASIELTATQIGILVSLGLAGGATGTLGVVLFANRFGQRRFLILLSLLFMMGGIGFSIRPSFNLMALLAFIGMVNGMGRDRGAAPSLEQAMLPEGGASATASYVRYWVVVDVGLAIGSLLGGIPGLLRQITDQVYPITFSIYTGLVALSGLFYLGLSPRWDAARPTPQTTLTPHSKRNLWRLSGLSAIDSFAGGFLASTLIAYWLYARFGVDETTVGPLFFAARVFNILSYLAAGWVAKKIGLLNTMVFTHLPSHLMLFGMAVSPTFSMAATFFLLRECLVEMDVPTRQAYLVAMVAPHERTFATGVVNLTRTAAWSVAPIFSGYAMASLSLLAPLIVGGGIKIVYDLLLLYSFRDVKPKTP